MIVKSVHKALHLRHYKHTGKILAHRHTSYRVLFLLLLTPIAMLALVDHMSVLASDYVVTATVPANMPSGAPVIVSPKNGDVINMRTVAVKGTCPVANTISVIAIYNNDMYVGSSLCGSDGRFTVTVPIMYDINKLVAKVITITGANGESSAPVIVAREGVDQAQVQQLSLPLMISTRDLFVVINHDGQASWAGSFNGGKPPYNVTIDWGDGYSDHRTVMDQTDQSFAHNYGSVHLYEVLIKVVDAAGESVVLNSVTVHFGLQQGILDVPTENVPPLIGFVQRYFEQIYIMTISAVVFLWYIEHGRHLQKRVVAAGVRKVTPKHRHRYR